MGRWKVAFRFRAVTLACRMGLSSGLIPLLVCRGSWIATEIAGGEYGELSLLELPLVPLVRGSLNACVLRSSSDARDGGARMEAINALPQAKRFCISSSR